MTPEEHAKVIAVLEYSQAAIGPWDLFEDAIAIMRREREPKTSYLTNDVLMSMALEWFTTGDNKSFPEGYRYRSLGVPRDVKERHLIEFARAIEGFHGIMGIAP